MGDDPREAIDVRVDSAAREGLTGTTPASIYKPLRETEQITVAPDWRPMDEQPAWRQDFPIDWPQDVYVERRDFVKFMALTSLAFTVGQFWIAGRNWLRRRRGRPPVARIASVDEVPERGVVTFAYPTEQDPCVLIRLAGGALVAYGQKCTHLSCAVIPNTHADVIECPCHEGAFDLRNGRPIAGPPRRPLARVRLEIRGRDVFATEVEERTA